MSTTTTNYGFIKPEKSDPADITASNENWDKLDEALDSRNRDLSMGYNKITNVAEPQSRSDVATRGFVEDFAIEGSTYVAVDENKDGNVVLRPYVPDVDDFAIEDEQYDGCYYRTVKGEKEWVNPPMVIGEEYRTSERYNGQAVYIKIVDCGNLPNNAQKDVAVGIKGKNAIDLEYAVYMSGNQLSTYPYIQEGTYNILTRMYLNNSGNLIITTNYDLSSYTAKVTIKYVKE